MTDQLFPERPGSKTQQISGAADTAAVPRGRIDAVTARGRWRWRWYEFLPEALLAVVLIDETDAATSALA